MPDVRIDGMSEAGYEGICAEHGTVALSNYETARKQVMIHMATQHDQTLILEGKDFWLVEAPLRCDLCGDITEPPGWDYKTDRPLTEVGDGDGEWLVCDGCHPLVVANNINGLISRAIVVHQRRSPGDGISNRLLELMRTQFMTFLGHCGEGVRESV